MLFWRKSPLQKIIVPIVVKLVLGANKQLGPKGTELRNLHCMATLVRSTLF